MDAMNVLLSRRSVRQFTDKPVPEEMVRELLHAAMSAPSAGNEKPWHFMVLTDRALLDAIPKVHPYAAMVKQAPAAIVVCGEPALEKYEGYWVLDCSIATENLLLAAHAKGLGAVWCGVYPTKDRVDALKKLLALPEQIVPFALVPIGFPAKYPDAVLDRFDAARVHGNRW